MKGRITRATILIVILALVLPLFVGPSTVSARSFKPKVHFWLTILHNNDGESQVIDAGSGLEDFGGAARFRTLVKKLKWHALTGPWTHRGAKRGVIMVSSGDNFLAGPEFAASLANGVPYYDAIAMRLIGYDAINLGNHDFDFGPDVLANFLDSFGFRGPPPYVSANLDFSGEPRLQAYVDEGVIVASTIIRERGEEIGVIGLETPNLPFISSPRNVVVDPNLVEIVQEQIDILEAEGVGIIVLSSHLQSIANELDLVSQVEGLDVVIAGGGDELLANPDDVLIPGDDAFVFGAYPQVAADLNGDSVPVVTTSGEYRYVGQLVVGFDRHGNVLQIHEERSGPKRVATDDCNGTLPCDDTVFPDPFMQYFVVNPVEEYVAELANIIVGVSEVDLEGRRAPGVRTQETNEGNLIADSLFWYADQVAAIYGVNPPDVALQNGGGIRNNTLIPAGNITELDTFSMVPFPNFVSLLENIPRDQFKEIMENAVSRVEFSDGRFAQISGFSMVYDPTGTAQILDLDGNVVTPGTRVVDLTLADGTSIVSGGAVVAGPGINIATIDFLARGGDQYPYRGAPFTSLGASYQQALSSYIQSSAGLGGTITAAQYPEGGEGRITP